MASASVSIRHTKLYYLRHFTYAGEGNGKNEEGASLVPRPPQERRESLLSTHFIKILSGTTSQISRGKREGLEPRLAHLLYNCRVH